MIKKIDTLIKILYNIYLLLKKRALTEVYVADEVHMTRQEVKEYLKISESTYKRKVKDGTLKPIKMPGGDRYTKTALMQALMESKRRGRT